MQFSQPEWFLLIPAFAFLGWYWKSLRLWRPLRIVCLGLITLILVNPQIEQMQPGIDLWVLVDRSDSAKPYLVPQLEETEQLLETSRGKDDTLNYLDFAGEIVERTEANADSRLAITDRTRLPLAAQMALTERDPKRQARLLLLSDGYSTESLEGLGERLRDERVELFYRLPPLDVAGDTVLENFRVPTTAKLGEPVLIEILAKGTPGHSAQYRLMRNETLIANETINFDDRGRAQMRLIDRQAQSGSHLYSALLTDPQDPLPGNNRAEAWVQVEGGPRILLLSAYSDDPLVTVLQRVGLPVQLITEFSTLNAGTVSGARAVVLNNLPANVLPQDFLDSLNFYVTHQGGGLVMAGGKYSFGSGGYFESPIDELLPISMELKEDHKKLAVAMAIVLDRSGSMGAGVAGGQTKMDLANAGAADTVELMGGQDAVTVFAVDSEPHQVVQLTGVTGNKEEIQQRIRSIASMGGGIFVYNGLKAAWDEIQKAPLGQKHIILFADAADAEQPADYKDLLNEMTDAGATVSVIGLGTDRDPDANFLKDIAKRGNGRIFFSKDPADIPAFFAQETVAVTRSAFIDEPVGCQPLADWQEISPRAIQWPSQVDGYNLSYLRGEAASALATTDEYNAPLVAFWRRGSGRTAAITFPIAGDYSQSVRAWPEFGDFLQTLSRWLIGDENDRDMGLRTRVDGNSLKLDLFYSEEWAKENPAESPTIVYRQSGSEDTLEGVWERIAPGQYSASIPLDANAAYLGAVQWGEKSLSIGPIAVQQSLEWQRPPRMRQALKDAAELSGGGSVTLLENIWQSDPQSRLKSISQILLILLAMTILAEALWFRLGRR